MHRQPIHRALRWYLPGDAAALLLGFVCAWMLATAINGVVYGRPVMSPLSEYGTLRLAEFILLAGGVLVWLQHTGHQRMRMPFWLETKKIVSALAIAMMADGFLQFAAKQDFSRLWLMSGWAIAAALMIGLRVLVRSRLRKNGLFNVRTLLVGNGDTAARTLAAIRSEPSLGYEIVSQIKDLPSAFLQAGKSWQELCALHGADHIIVALDGTDLNNAEQPLAQLVRESVPFSVSPPLRHLPVLGMTPQYFFNHDVMLMTRSSGLEQPLHCFIKRALDILVSCAALIALSPMMLTLAALVKRDGGPAFFGHSRVGRGGRPFPCLKFRSMVMNGEEALARHLAENPEARAEWHATRKLKDDPRITSLGDFLRRSSLDELPQLINVLKGEMSLVGPRPIMPGQETFYGDDFMYYGSVRPGITGPWQVSGRNKLPFKERVALESWYARNWNLWMDIVIILKTVPTLLKKDQAF